MVPMQGREYSELSAFWRVWSAMSDSRQSNRPGRAMLAA